MLKLNTVTKSYDQQLAIEDVSLAIKPGTFVAIVGQSGSGKTTLLRLVAGFLKPTKGEITSNGTLVVGPGRDRGMVFQQFSLFPWLTVTENISFGLKVNREDPKVITKIVEKYLTITGLENYKDAYPATLSGGMQQRVAIARTLAANPDILLLDEPFAALDVQTRMKMQEFLLELWQGERKTVMMVTHDIEEALLLADTIIVLSKRPAVIKEVIPVPFGRPRNGKLRYSAAFTKLKQKISALVD